MFNLIEEFQIVKFKILGFQIEVSHGLSSRSLERNAVNHKVKRKVNRQKREHPNVDEVHPNQSRSTLNEVRNLD